MPRRSRRDNPRRSTSVGRLKESRRDADEDREGLSLELRLLRDRVDLLHVAARERPLPWYRDVRGIVSVLALAVSCFGAVYTLVADRATEARVRRHEIKKIIQSLAEMRLTNARDMAVVTDGELRQRIDNVMLQKQRMLLEAADAIVAEIPDDITAAEYTTLAWENGSARQLTAKERYLGRALAESPTSMRQAYALRNLALFYFDRVNAPEKGRETFAQSVA
jgi:hypothetical protein